MEGSSVDVRGRLREALSVEKLEEAQIALAAAQEVNGHLNAEIERLTLSTESLAEERDVFRSRVATLSRALAEAQSAVSRAQAAEAAESEPGAGRQAAGRDDASHPPSRASESAQPPPEAPLPLAWTVPSPSNGVASGMLPEACSSVDWPALRRLGEAQGWLLRAGEVWLGAPLGEGSFGATYLGVWRGGRVAVKCLRATQGEAALMFAREVGALSAVRHPNVLALVGACVDPPLRCWLVTELLAGGTLGDWLYGPRPAARRPLSAGAVDVAAAEEAHVSFREATQALDGPSGTAAESLQVMSEASDASNRPASTPTFFGRPLPGSAKPSSPSARPPSSESASARAAEASSRAGERGAALPDRDLLSARLRAALDVAAGMAALEASEPPLLHRDLKPGNILLDAGGRAKVADFGLARALLADGGCPTGETGTYLYMAPEVVRHEPYGTPADVWSWAVLCCELASREKPYAALRATPVQVALEVSRGRLAPEVPRFLSQALRGLLHAALQADPWRRPSFERALPVVAEAVLLAEREERALAAARESGAGGRLVDASRGAVARWLQTAPLKASGIAARLSARLSAADGKA